MRNPEILVKKSLNKSITVPVNLKTKYEKSFVGLLYCFSAALYHTRLVASLSKLLLVSRKLFSKDYINFPAFPLNSSVEILNQKKEQVPNILEISKYALFLR